VITTNPATVDGDWAPGINDAFNQFSNCGVTNAASDVDLREMDVIGATGGLHLEPPTGILLFLGSSLLPSAS
jgi:hypothetical protein